MGSNREDPEVPGIPQGKVEDMDAENRATLRGHQISVNPTNELRYKRNIGFLKRLRQARDDKLANGVDPKSREIRQFDQGIRRCKLEIELYRLAVQTAQDIRQGGRDRLKTD